MNAKSLRPVDRARRILIADDSRVERHVLERLFASRGYEVEVVSNGMDACRMLEADDAPRLAVLDWSMPGLDGVDVCRRVRARSDRPYAYLILLTSKDRCEDLDEAMDAGADDYLSKPFRVDELIARVRAGQRVLDSQSALLDAQDRLSIQATHDALTGEWNRATILEMLERELAQARIQRTSVAVVLADIDRFKTVNDTYGHDAGDTVIRHTMARIKSSLRASDRIGRYGGEELLVVLPGCPADAVGDLAERARLAVDGAFVLHGRTALSVTISIGAVASAHRPDVTAASLITEADRALYRAKNSGRNRVELGGDAPMHRTA